MTNPDLNLPEPSFPEHELIRDAAPMPQLSAGFKSRVMQECAISIVRAQRVYRLKVAGAVVAVCCLVLLICLLPTTEVSSDPAVVEQPATSAPSTSLGLPSTPSGLAVDANQPKRSNDPDRKPMSQMIEDLKGRQQIFDANMLPRF